jgi:hypothetical protein
MGYVLCKIKLNPLPGIIVRSEERVYEWYGKASALNHTTPEKIDHPRPELNACY